MSNKLSPILGIFLLVVGAGRLYAQDLYYNGSVQSASGSYYFSEKTRSLYLTNGLSLDFGKAGLALDIPLIVQSTPWISHGGSGGIPTGGPQHGAVGGRHGNGMGTGIGRRYIHLPDTASYNQVGIGDPTVWGKYYLISTDSGLTTLLINTAVKIPIAHTGNGFGTGAWDAGAGIMLSGRVSTLFLSGSVMYWSIGDMPGLQLKNTLSYSAGAGFASPNSRLSLLVSYSGMTAVISDIDSPQTAGIGIGYRLSAKTNLSLNASIGLSESVADYTIGTGLQVKLNRHH